MNALIDISNVVLNTDRLVLRAFRESDLEDLYEYACVDGVGQMAGWEPHKNISESKVILDMFIREKKVFAIEFGGKVIGSLGIEEYHTTDLPELEDKKGREIGYVLSKEYWGIGLMPEAVNRVIDYCFNDLGLDFLMCGHFVNNNQSRRVQEKCGFRHYKLFKRLNRWGVSRDCWYSILENNK